MQISNISRPRCIFRIISSTEEPVQVFELNLWQILAKNESRCQGNSGEKITQNDGILIKTCETTRWAVKKTGKK